LGELKSGRFYAKRALAMLGLHGVDIPIGSNRAPMWPRGVVGSLTHVRGRDGGHVAAAVGRESEFRAIGIDVETEGGLHPSLWDQVLTAREFERVGILPATIRSAEAQLVWCAKEAFIKAIRQLIDPMEVEIDRDANSYGYPATWRVRTVGSDPSTHTWTGQSIRSSGFVLAAVAIGQGRLGLAALEI
jgi:4'-phosphopantetheinyl transferase EntD